MNRIAARFRRWVLAVLLCGAVLPAHAAAQQCMGAGNWRGIESVNPLAIVFSTPNVVDFDSQGIIYGSIVTVDIRSTRQGTVPLEWSLCLNADTPDLGSSQGVTKPLSDLQFELLDGNWQPVTATVQRIRTGTGDSTIQLRVRMRLAWDADPPGAFGTILRFTVGS